MKRVSARTARLKILTGGVLTVMLLARGWNLWNRGILDHDEGHALLNANTWHHIMRWTLSGGPFHSSAEALGQLRDRLHAEGGTLYSAGKFGYSLLLAAVALPGQVTQGLGLVLAWVAGSAVCVLAGVLAWLYTRKAPAAAIASLGCASSYLLLYLGREVSGTIWALAFALGGACALQAALAGERHSRKWSVLGGLLLGYSFSCHYNIAPFILAVFAAAGWQSWRRDKRLFGVVIALFPAGMACVAILALFEIVTQIIDYRLRNIFPEYRSVFGELRHLFFTAETGTFKGQTVGDGVIGWGAEAWWYYGRVLLREGVIYALIGLLLFPTVRKNLRTNLSALLLLVLPALFWAAYAHRVERVLGMVVAAGWIYAGVICTGLFDRSASNREIRTASFILSLAITFGIMSGTILLRQASPIPATVDKTLDYMTGHDGSITASSFHPAFAPVWKWTVVEKARNPAYARARVGINFATFARPDIMFFDPESTGPVDPSQFILPNGVDQYHLVTGKKTRYPEWSVESRDLRRTVAK